MRAHAALQFVRLMGLMIYFAALPLLMLVVLNWAAYQLTATTFYQAPWMMPALLMFSAFLGGALIRQKMEDDEGGMVLFFIAVLALILCALVLGQDIHLDGAYVGRFMPKLLPYWLGDYLYAVPGLGIVGMLFFKYFTLKHYS